MAETVTINEPTASEREPAEAPAKSHEEGLPENFKSVGDLAHSYREAQAELTRLKQGQPPKADEGHREEKAEGEKAEEAPAKGEKAEEKPEGEEAPASINEKLEPFSAEFVEKGELSEDSFTQLEALGFDRGTVETYIDNLPTTEKDAERIYETVGGQDKYGELTGWAQENLSPDDIAAFDKAVASRGKADIAVKWLMAERKAMEGFEAQTTVEGKSAASSPSDVYLDRQAMTKDMGDERYQTGDKAFHQYVEDKIRRSRAAGHLR